MPDEKATVPGVTPPGGGDTTTTPAPVPYDRFEEVNKLATAYKDLGTPDELKQLVDDYYILAEEFTKRGKSEEKPATKKEAPASQLSPEKQEAFKRQLEELVPGIGRIGDVIAAMDLLSKNQQTSSNASMSRIQQEASKETAQLVKAAGYDSSTVKYIEELLANKIHADRKLNSRLYSGDLSVVSDTFKDMDEQFFSKQLIRPASKPALPDIIARYKGTPSGAPSHTPASEAEFSKLSTSEKWRNRGDEAYKLMLELVSQEK